MEPGGLSRAEAVVPDDRGEGRPQETAPRYPDWHITRILRGGPPCQTFATIHLD